MADCQDVVHLVKPGMKGAEIGVRFGDSAVEFLKAGAFMYLIDPWIPYPGYFELSFGEDGYQQTRRAIEPYVGHYVLLRKKSADALADVPDDLDFLFIDGNHAYDFIKQDLANYWPKVKPGGWFTGHDYTNEPPQCEVKRAVDEFAAEHGLTILPNGQSWIIRKPGGVE